MTDSLLNEVLARIHALDSQVGPDSLDRIHQSIDDISMLPDVEAEHCIRELSKKTEFGITMIRTAVRECAKKRKDAERDSRTGGRGEVDEPPQYDIADGGIVLVRKTKDGVFKTPITNFVARIESVVERDDGLESANFLEIAAEVMGVKSTFTIRASDFDEFRWIVPHIGPEAIIYPGSRNRDHARVGIQQLSGKPPRQKIFVYTGWRTMEGNKWVYLHAGGAIGAEGVVDDVKVTLPPALENFALPVPPVGETLNIAVRAALTLAQIGPPRIGWPLLSQVFRAPLGHCDCSLFLTGPTGVFKTELAALGQSFFGNIDARNLPASWSSTGNAIETLLFTAKDTLLVIDDWAPQGSTADLQRYQRDADRVFRGQGNRSGRARLSSDTTLRQARQPRGSVISTGEDVPAGQSIRARLFIVEMAPGDIAGNVLARYQTGEFKKSCSSAMSAYIQWLARNHDKVRSERDQRIEDFRDRSVGENQHRRTPANVAQLQWGTDVFLQFAVESGSLTKDEADNLGAACFNGLLDSTAEQTSYLSSSEPTELFRRLLVSQIASGGAHVANIDGERPERSIAIALGWELREVPSRNPENASEVWIPKGPCVGWIDTDTNSLYLDIDSAYKAANAMGSAAERLAISAKTLGSRLAQKGLLVTQDDARGKHTIRRTIQGSRLNVLHLPSSFILDRSAAEKEPSNINLSPSGAQQTSLESIAASDPTPPMFRCVPCGGTEWWRLKENTTWFCRACSPPTHSNDQIVTAVTFPRALEPDDGNDAAPPSQER